MFHPIIYKKYHTRSEGYVIEAKFEYEDEEGNKNWYFVRYKHLDNINSFVKKGQKVKKGTVIASLSNTGLTSSKHLHISLWKYMGNKKWRCINFVQNSTFNNRVVKYL